MAKAKSVQGVGNSRRFGGTTRLMRQALAGLHVGGRSVEDLPAHDLARLDYQHTDEGIAARNTGRSESLARVLIDPVEKSIRQRGDFRASEINQFEAPDPMGDLVKKHVPPGMRAKFLSPRRIARHGLRGCEVVTDRHGDPVKLGEMVLGQMPEQLAQSRNRTYQRKGQARLQSIKQDLDEGQQRILGNARRRSAAMPANDSLSADGPHSREDIFID
jgi:hypothetical protein